MLSTALRSQPDGWILLTALQTASFKERREQDVDGKYNRVKNLNVAPEAHQVLCFHKQLCYCYGLRVLLPLLRLAVKARSY